MKTCSKCLVEKDESEFYKGTHSARCKACHNAACKARYQAKPKEIIAKTAAYRAANRHVSRRTNWRARGVDLATVPSVEGNRCALCNSPGKVCLDHDHVTGKFRGWLCNTHNRALGLFRDDPAMLRAAAAYVERI